MTKRIFSLDHSPMECAKYLVQRHSDIGFIRAYILADFGTAPTREQITKMREEHVRKLEWEKGKFERTLLSAEQRKAARGQRA